MMSQGSVVSAQPVAAKVQAPPRTEQSNPTAMTEERLVHQWISDVYLITNESGAPSKGG